MNNQQIPEILSSFGKILKHEPLPHASGDAHQNFRSYKPDEVNDFIYDLTEAGNRNRLVFMPNTIGVDELQGFLDELEFPVLFFISENGSIRPVMFWLGKDALEAKLFTDDGYKAYEEATALRDEAFYQDAHGQVVFLTVFPYRSMVSEDNETSDEHLSPLKRLLNLLGTERRDIWYIYIYAVAVGIISLSLPLGTQAIVGFISGGMWFNSVVLLISLVVIGVLVAGGLQIMQISMVEVLQRRIFAKASFEFAYRIPRIRSEALFNYHAPELINRFFDIMTIQKGLPKLLIDLSTAVLQIFFSLILLSFYHPFFVFFGLLLVAILVTIFYITGPKGLKSSIVESKYKYKVAFWLEELARTIGSFKIAGTTQLPMKKADFNINNYLKYRKEHFSVLIKQFSYVVIFKTFITGGLLILGTLLVIDRQITLGQFVASEIIIVLILGAVEKIILNMDTVYDMLTAVDKIGHVTDLPLEKNEGIKLPANYFENGININIKNLSYTYPGGKKAALKNINLSIKAGEKLCIAGYHSGGKSTLANIIDGIYQSYDGIVTFNQLSLRDVDLNTLRDHIAKNVSQDDIFDGTVLDNVTVGKPRSDYSTAIKAIDEVGISDEVNQWPDGLHTNLVSGGKNISTSTAHKLTLARCVAKNPKVIILNDFFQFFEGAEKLKLIKYLTSSEHTWTLLLVSNDPMIMKYCDRVIIMKDGEIVSEGQYEELSADHHLQEVVVNE
ncbi:ABC-type bacteriocin/lantibiotic exporter with double-glycine peptidase domain [Catalinimonas alkaloidigena]|uniref:peptidase domain-containing ABC transporter n=1 Tax=Catalinimonas alkaloidigena TaxID=1075417 RepID=UPI002405A5A7|nr:ATP-binding cassette domain-containing protein [Catalinimonas alkaloidigena]MDF9795507.1 ABC-type bacteriocin/lantibiotic exporter with double-glycine peptidase domain [Catalinimonas alkaloidigena]